MSEPTLLHCPFCKGEARLYHQELNDCPDSYFVIECRSCEASSGYKINEKEAIEAWNQRVPDDKYNELVEFLKSRVIGSGCNIIGELCVPCDALDLLRKHGIEV